MFDDDHNSPPNRLWYRIAMNLLYAGKNKNLVVQARNQTFDRAARKKSLMDLSGQSFSSTMVSKKRTNTMRNVIKKSDNISRQDIDSKEGSLDGDRTLDREVNGITNNRSKSPVKRPNAVLQAMSNKEIMVR